MISYQILPPVLATRLFHISALALSLAVTACGAGSNGVDGTSGTNGTNGTNGSNGLTALSLSSSEAPGLHCAVGGVRIAAGLDANANMQLDAAEVSSTHYVCNGTAGAAGSAGLASLVSMVAEPAGSNCANSGYKISVGLDANGNNILDVAEITSSQYLCQANAGANGSNGTNGISSLMAIVTETAGANCTYAGSKITSGPDTNANGVLDAGELSTTVYTCNGAPGPGVSWVDVSATSVAGQSNIGYLANNASQVTVTLPNAPQIGDLLQLSGVGAGGWRIAQNAGQSILSKGIAGSNAPAGLSWTARDSVRAWDGITSSSDGSKLAAFVQNGQIYTSTDSGVSWVARETNRSWDGITSSSDGSKLVALVNPGQIYTSSDSGVNWIARDSSRSWRAISSSSDGVKLAAAVDSGQIYTSSDSGVSWTARDSNRAWIAIASSSDGSKLAAVVANGQVYTSSDSGVSWTARDSNRNWNSIASSSDGSKLVAGVFGGQIYTSTDAGVNWIARDINRNWYAIASSSDGSRLAAAVLANKIYTSNDFGLTWAARDSNRFWRGITSSANGNQLAALESSGLIYTSVGVQTTPGVAGSITGGQYDTLSLQFVGAGLWLPLSYTIFSSSGILAY
ncbi:hypothetical protein [Undibacterium sp.]|uniref:DUF7151 family protein n=1 Tax=Undibacterium sp. TaxID=1914977 RepID=UPI0025DF5336|nr:hypothetical protein [Undibacterium sp.]